MNTIFVSSTFKDMQFERDIIQKQVLPRLQEFAKSYGETVEICDLENQVPCTFTQSYVGVVNKMVWRKS